LIDIDMAREKKRLEEILRIGEEEEFETLFYK
jgi:hypothetical protein